MGFPTFYWVQNAVQHYKIIILACYYKRTTKGPTYLSLLRLLNTLNLWQRKQDCFRNYAYVSLQYLRSRHRRAVVAAVHADVVAHTILGGTWWGGTHHGCGSALRRWPHAVRRRSWAHETNLLFNINLYKLIKLTYIEKGQDPSKRVQWNPSLPASSGRFLQVKKKCCPRLADDKSPSACLCRYPSVLHTSKTQCLA